ncbi:hypothetical protein KSS87_022848 [Heliosperma pusillum]|nr:hypothetical protein KSS87_022848 [Heliosperma pusillum]
MKKRQKLNLTPSVTQHNLYDQEAASVISISVLQGIHPTTADEADELYSDEVGVTETVDCGGLTNRCRRSSIDGGANFDQKAGASR